MDKERLDKRLDDLIKISKLYDTLIENGDKHLKEFYLTMKEKITTEINDLETVKKKLSKNK